MTELHSYHLHTHTHIELKHNVTHHSHIKWPNASESTDLALRTATVRKSFTNGA